MDRLSSLAKYRSLASQLKSLAETPEATTNPRNVLHKMVQILDSGLRGEEATIPRRELPAPLARAMRVEILAEAGYEQALLGLALNKDKDPAKMPPVLAKLAPMDHGHNKALEHIYVWLLVTAPRYWWQEADTYRVGTSKQSQSTMHTGLSKHYENHHFSMDPSPEVLARINAARESGDLMALKANMPEGFLQTRQWVLNYKVIKSLIDQRQTHRLPEWQVFLRQLAEQLEHPELLPFRLETLDKLIDSRG